MDAEKQARVVKRGTERLEQLDRALMQSGGVRDDRWVREFADEVAHRLGVSRADLLYKIAREWLLSLDN